MNLFKVLSLFTACHGLTIVLVLQTLMYPVDIAVIEMFDPCKFYDPLSVYVIRDIQ